MLGVSRGGWLMVAKSRQPRVSRGMRTMLGWGGEFGFLTLWPYIRQYGNPALTGYGRNRCA